MTEKDSYVTNRVDSTLFEALFVAYPDALLVVDLKGVVLLANPAAVELLGYSANDLRGLSVDALVPDAIRPRHEAYRNVYAAQPRARPMGTQMELVAKRRDNTEVMVEIALSPLSDNGLPYVVAAIRGVGAYPRVKQALQRSRYAEYLAQFSRLAVDVRDPRVLLERLPQIAIEALQVERALIFLLEGNGVEFRVAARAGIAHGYALGSKVPNDTTSLPGFVLAQPAAVLVTEYPREKRFKVPAHHQEAGLVSGVTVPLFDRGQTTGILAVDSSARQRFSEDEVRFLTALSNLLATALQRDQSDEALRHTQRLESIGQLTGGVAHDFNNLLTVIAGNLQLLGDACTAADDGVAQPLIEAAQRATRRGAELTNKLLTFSRRQVLQPSVIDAAALLHSLTDMLSRTLDQQISISLDADDALCLADPTQLEAALLNIAINARDAMPEGGSLKFSCRIVDSLPAELLVQWDRPEAGAYVAISVVDTGTGMSETVMEHAFEPFFTTKEAGRGTGLGLSTVYGFAKQSGGAVSLSSTLGAGTSVTLYLPSIEDEDNSTAILVDAVGAPEGLRVLLVEDDTEVRSVIEALLTSMSCDTLSCGHVTEALDVLATGMEFDLLITDIALGAGMRGTELAAEVRTRRPELPILLMSGYSSDLSAAPPQWELLRKPCTRTDLERAIVRVLESSQWTTAASLDPALP